MECTCPENWLRQMTLEDLECGLGGFGAEIARRGGDPVEVLGKLGSDRRYREMLARVAVRGGQEWPQEALARRIMGKDGFFGRDEWAERYGVRIPVRQARAAGINKFPWSEAVLDSQCPFYGDKCVAETHFAFLGIRQYNGRVAEAHGPLTIMGWQKIYPAGSGQPCFYSYETDCWYYREEFAAVPLELRWQLALKEVVPSSAEKEWDGMLALLPDEYVSGSPVCETTKDILVRTLTGAYPNQDIYAATDILDSFRRRVVVGSCGDDSVDVGYWNGGPDVIVGLSAFRKSGA